MNNQQEQTASPYLTPTELIKKKSVDLLFEIIEHNSKSIDEKDMYAFYNKAKDLSILLERYTPKNARKEIQEWYKQLDNEIKKIKESGSTEQIKKKKIMELQYTYAIEVHNHNERILMNSPIIEIEAEGELDISDNELIAMVQGGKRTDDKRITS